MYKKLLKGPLLTLKLNLLHKKAYPLAKKICEQEKIDVIHQITPIEFRSIGKYGKIQNTKFVCGPLGGGEHMPKSFRGYAKGHRFVEKARSFLNCFSRWKYKWNTKLAQCDYILFANYETQSYLKELVQDVPHKVFFDNGISESEFSETKRTTNDERPFTMLVAGRLNYRKGHSFLFDVLKGIDQDYVCRVAGTGDKETELKAMCKNYGIEDKVVFLGRLPYEEMFAEYEKADLFVMPSIRETTGAVLLEAMSKGLGVVTINKFGGPVLFDEEAGCFFKGDTLNEYKDSLKETLLCCMNDTERLRAKGERLKELAKSHLWSEKMKFYNTIYTEVVSKQENL